jgi:Spy/CpxP family protein refolding chaperone
MKYLAKITLPILAILGLLTVLSVLADPAFAATSSEPTSASEQPKKCDRWEKKEQRLESLKSDLKLNPNQEIAWTEWVNKIKGDHKGWEERRKNEESWASLSAPERMEKMLAFSKEHIAKQEERLAATKTFYVILSPEQRQIFDKGFNFEHHGRLARHEKK